MNWANSFFQKVPETLSTDGRTDRRTDRHRGESNIAPFYVRWSGGIIIANYTQMYYGKEIPWYWCINVMLVIHMSIRSHSKCGLRALKIAEFADNKTPDSKVHGANMGSTWVLSAPDAQWANGGGGLQSPTSQHGGHQNRRTRQGLV